jgi:tetratricopeptide (TPR) repeat protein
MIGVRLANLGRLSEGFERVKRGERLIRDTQPSWRKAWVLSSAASGYILTGEDIPKGVDLGKQAVTLATSLGLDEIRAEASQFVGTGRLMLDDPAGVDDIHASMRASEGLNSPTGVLCDYNNSEAIRNMGDVANSSRLLGTARQKAERLGSQFWLRAIQVNEVIDRYYRGRWAEARTLADSILAEITEGAQFLYQAEIRVVRARIQLVDDEREKAAHLASGAMDWARELAEPQVLLPSLALQARVFIETGNMADAGDLVDEALEHVSSQALTSWGLSDLAISLSALKRPHALEAAASALRVRTPWLEAAIALSLGHLHEAATIYASIGSLPDEAYARHRSGEQLRRQGRPVEGRAELERAVELWDAMGSGELHSAQALLTEPA